MFSGLLESARVRLFQTTDAYSSFERIKVTLVYSILDLRMYVVNMAIKRSLLSNNPKFFYTISKYD
jgi:hypothetical protein